MDYNAYEILGLSADATRDEIDARYKELRENISATDFFPEREGEEASEKLQQVEVAYRDILSSMDESEQKETFVEDDSYVAIQDLITAR